MIERRPSRNTRMVFYTQDTYGLNLHHHRNHPTLIILSKDLLFGWKKSLRFGRRTPVIPNEVRKQWLAFACFRARQRPGSNAVDRTALSCRDRERPLQPRAR